MRDEKDLVYTNTHEWADIDGDTAYIGISDYAQEQMGDIVFINLPEVGDEIEAGEVFGDIESVKAVSDLYSPVSGTVVEVNEEVLDNPALINEQPFEAWFVKVAPATKGEGLLDADGIAQLIENEK